AAAGILAANDQGVLLVMPLSSGGSLAGRNPGSLNHAPQFEPSGANAGSSSTRFSFFAFARSARYCPGMEKSERPPPDPELRRRIQDLIAYKGGGHNTDLVADIIENALKILSDVEARGDVRVIQTAVRELRYAFKLFAPHAHVHKVTLFGSARTPPTKKEYQQAVDFARKIANAGWMVITGAGPGIMQAGHEGAGPERSFGANIRLPWEQAANPIIQRDKKLITFKYFFTRKLTFVRHSDAIVLFPGGFGTMDEGYEALTLMQTGKSRIMPLILMDTADDG